MTGPWACLLCGDAPADPRDVRMALVRWVEPDAERRFSSVPRCIDRAACRARVEAAGGAWEVQDGVTLEERPRRGFSDGHRTVFEAAARWRAERPPVPEPMRLEPPEPADAPAPRDLGDVFA